MGSEISTNFIGVVVPLVNKDSERDEGRDLVAIVSIRLLGGKWRKGSFSTLAGARGVLVSGELISDRTSKPRKIVSMSTHKVSRRSSGESTAVYQPVPTHTMIALRLGVVQSIPYPYSAKFLQDRL